MGKSYKRNYKRRSKRMRRSCDMKVDLLYRTPCQGLPLNSDFSQGGGNQQVNNVGVTSGCSSYQIDVTQPPVGGQAVIGGNPSNCLSSQMTNVTNFGGASGGGGAACAGYTFGLSPSDQIAGQAGVKSFAPNCMYGAGNGKKGKGTKANKAKPKDKNAKAKPKPNKPKLSKKDNTILRNAIDNYCVRKQIKCSRKFKKDLYNVVRERLCN